MPQRSSKKKPRDINQLAYDVVRSFTEGEQPLEEERQKLPAAVELGRLGGLKGGRARAQKLSAKKRKEIAKKAALVRWKRD